MLSVEPLQEVTSLIFFHFSFAEHLKCKNAKRTHSKRMNGHKLQAQQQISKQSSPRKCNRTSFNYKGDEDVLKRTGYLCLPQKKMETVRKGCNYLITKSHLPSTSIVKRVQGLKMTATSTLS